MTFRFFLLILLALVSASNIDVYLDVEIYSRASVWKMVKPKVSASGQDVAIISDTERKTFNLTDDNLKNAVYSYVGIRPIIANLHSSPDWLTGSDDWQEVTRTLRPQFNDRLKASVNDSYIQEEVFTNNMTKPANFNVGISQRVQDTVSSSWSKEGELSIAEKIKYSITILANDRKFFFWYTSAWGENAKIWHQSTIGATSPMEITLEPGQSVTSQLHVTKGNIKLKVKYAAKLSGQIYYMGFTGTKVGQFGLANITECMHRSGLSNLIMSQEVIDIDFYVESKVIVYDTNGTKLMETVYSVL